jgi:hypothetical protein
MKTKRHCIALYANSALEFAYFQEIFRPQNFFLVAQNKVKVAPVGVVISVQGPRKTVVTTPVGAVCL